MIFETDGLPAIFDYVSYFFSKFKCIVKVCEENHDDLDGVMVFFANLNYMDGV